MSYHSTGAYDLSRLQSLTIKRSDAPHLTKAAPTKETLDYKHVDLPDGTLWEEYDSKKKRYYSKVLIRPRIVDLGENKEVTIEGKKMSQVAACKLLVTIAEGPAYRIKDCFSQKPSEKVLRKQIAAARQCKAAGVPSGKLLECSEKVYKGGTPQDYLAWDVERSGGGIFPSGRKGTLLLAGGILGGAVLIAFVMRRKKKRG